MQSNGKLQTFASVTENSYLSRCENWLYFGPAHWGMDAGVCRPLKWHTSRWCNEQSESTTESDPKIQAH